MRITTINSLQTISKTLAKYLDLISPTYGPAGKKVLIAHSEFNLKAVDDGYEASKEFELENEFENAVILYIKEATRRTNERAGDGTTTAGILTGAIFNETIGDLTNPLLVLKKNYHKEVKGIEKGIKEAIDHIKKNSKKIKTKQELYNIAFNSYNNENIATLISDTLFKIGENGLLAIGDSQTAETEIEMIEGLEVERGYVSPYFINSEKEEVVLQDSLVLTFNQRIDVFKDIVPVIVKAKEITNKLTIIAEGFSEETINNLIIGKIQGMISPLLIETPGFGDNKLENLKDIAILTGATVIDSKTIKYDEIKAEHFGKAKKVVAKKDKTLIIGGLGKKEDIQTRVAELTEKAERMTAVYEQEALKRHIASLAGGMALIKVGANTENEQKAIKLKVEDSINATKLAFKEGIVKGGGQTYSEIKTSSDILNRALKAPANQLKENGEEYLDKNVTDPAGVLIAALETAGSIACGLLEMGAIIATKREEDKN